MSSSYQHFIVILLMSSPVIAFTFFGLRRINRRYQAMHDAIDSKFDAWREADDSYFAAMRALLEANANGNAASAERLEPIVEELWQKAEEARKRALATGRSLT